MLPTSSSSPSSEQLLAGGSGGRLSGATAALRRLLTARQLAAILAASSALFKGLTGAVLVGFVLARVLVGTPAMHELASVVPGRLLPPNLCVWTLVTHSFVETRLVELAADCFVLLLYTQMLEPMWGRLECLRFYFAMTAAVGLSLALVYFACFALTFDEHYLFNRYSSSLSWLTLVYALGLVLRID